MIRKTQQIKNGKFLDLIKKKVPTKIKKKQIRKTASMSFESLKKKIAYCHSNFNILEDSTLCSKEKKEVD